MMKNHPNTTNKYLKNEDFLNFCCLFDLPLTVVNLEAGSTLLLPFSWISLFWKKKISFE
jgi:hypothetical protein